MTNIINFMIPTIIFIAPTTTTITSNDVITNTICSMVHFTDNISVLI